MMLIEDLNEATHVGAFEFLGEIDIHVDTGHRLLAAVRLIQNGDGIADVLDTHLVDTDVAVIPGVLDVSESLIR
jgi:hypothetical protein